jgi:hypothetical protein
MEILQKRSKYFAYGQLWKSLIWKVPICMHILPILTPSLLPYFCGYFAKRIKRQGGEWRIINCKGFGRNRLWPNRHTILTFPWRHCGVTRRTSGKTVGRATCYGLDGPGSIPGRARFFSSAQRRDRLWGPPSLLSNEYQGLFLQG